MRGLLLIILFVLFPFPCLMACSHLFISPFTVTFEDLFSNCATCYSSIPNSHISTFSIIIL